MIALAQATDNATGTDLRRITEDDPDYQRLHQQTVARLARSLRQYIREEQRGIQGADSRFIQRHTKLMKQAYIAAHHEGQKDYWPAVSRRTVQHRFVQPDPTDVQKRLSFYALGSVLKLAHQVKSCVAAQKNAQNATTARLVEFPDFPGALQLDDLPADYANRVVLQGQVVWSGLQDGYSDAGASDTATPYAELYWNLGPVVTEHCADCPELAMGSPYDPPWAGAGSNQLNQTPGDGQTDCGAGCKCSLSYSAPQGDALSELGKAIADKWNDWYPTGYDAMGNVLTQPLMPPAAGDVLTDAQKAALDDFRNSSDMWDTVRRNLPPMPSLFGTEDLPSPLPAWEQLTTEQQAVVQRVEQAQEAWLNAAGQLVPPPIPLPDPATEMEKWLTLAGTGAFTPWWNEIDITPSQESEIQAWLDAVGRGEVVQWPTPQQPEEYDAMQKWLEWASEHLPQQTEGADINTDFHASEPEQPVIELYNPNHGSDGRFTYGISEADTGKAPFDAEDFREAVAKGTPASTSSINPVKHADINGEHYYFKPVKEDATAGKWGGLYGNPGDFADVPNAEEYEVRAEAASAEIGKALGFGDQVTDTYDVHDDLDNHFSVSKALPETSTLEDGYQEFTVGGQHYNLQAQLNLEDKNLQNLVLHEYIVGDPDRHSGNYMITNDGKHIYQIDMGRSLRYNGTGLNMDSAAMRLISQRFRPSSQWVPMRTVNRVLSRESKVIDILTSHGLTEAIPGVKARFKTLRDWLNTGNTSLYNLWQTGGTMDL